MLTTNVTSLELLESYQCGLEVSFRKRPARARPTAAAATGWTALGGNGATELALISQSRSEEHTSELQSLMRISYAVFCLKKKTAYSCSIFPHTSHIHTTYYLLYLTEEHTCH